MQKMTFYARELRANSTEAEMTLWRLIRGRQIAGFKFRRQVVFENYIVDFVCFERKLVIELDGGQHMIQAEYDANRTDYLNSCGFQVLRFWNHQVFDNPIAVQERLHQALVDE